MKTFTKQNLPQLRADIDAALAAVAAKHGIKLQTGNISFNPNEATIKLMASAEGAAEHNLQMLRQFAKLDGINADGVGRQGEKLIDYDHKKPKYPYIFERGGKRFKCAPDQARMIFGAAQ